MKKITKINNLNKSKKIIFLQNLVMYFYISAFFGWLLETIFAFMVGNNEKRGFLYSPICPIYGLGAMLLILVYNQIRKRKIKNNYIIFILLACTFTVLEYFSSLILELLFGMRWWDYSDLFLNFQGRISLAYSIAFSVVGMVFIKLLKNPILKFIKRIRKKIKVHNTHIVLSIFSILFIIDIVFSCIRYA